MTNKEILIATKELILKEGWWTVHNPKVGGYCLLLALHKISGSITSQNYLTTTLIIKNIIEDPTASIPSWNDTPGRTEKEVFDLLDKAIELCK